MKVELHHLKKYCVLKRLRLFIGKNPQDVPTFTIMGTRGDDVIIRDNQHPERQFIISQKEIVLI